MAVYKCYYYYIIIICVKTFSGQTCSIKSTASKANKSRMLRLSQTYQTCYENPKKSRRARRYQYPSASYPLTLYARVRIVMIRNKMSMKVKPKILFEDPVTRSNFVVKLNTQNPGKTVRPWTTFQWKQHDFIFSRLMLTQYTRYFNW